MTSALPPSAPTPGTARRRMAWLVSPCWFALALACLAWVMAWMPFEGILFGVATFAAVAVAFTAGAFGLVGGFLIPVALLYACWATFRRRDHLAQIWLGLLASLIAFALWLPAEVSVMAELQIK